MLRLFVLMANCWNDFFTRTHLVFESFENENWARQNCRKSFEKFQI